MIVAHAPKTYFGSGDIQKSLSSLPGFPWAKYPGEKHLPGHNYTGPVGDRVRIFKYKSKLEKGYVGYWTNEIFIVDKVNTTSPPTYELIDQDKEQIIVEFRKTVRRNCNKFNSLKMANKFGLGSLSLKTKKPNTTAWINKANPYFVDQIGDTLQGDLDMNNFSITNLKSPENDNDAIHKKYLREQINSIEVNKNHLEDKISNVKRFFIRQLNNKNFVNDTKLQQELKVDSIFFTQGSPSSNKFNAREVLQFINGRVNVETKEYESNDENNKVDHLYEIKTSGKYIDRFRLLIIPDKKNDIFTLDEFNMILETESPPSMNIIKNPEPQKEGNMKYEQQTLNT
ncbi:hypothetical protein LOTGIDRAFT_152453 [Lottia gigantea]|uniref:Uncharacterized protein n=1 Tax=Lottia gigantea TaxID=225164 RepID=V4BCX1_LOTGI|nr:hypothetical protein LOTGIDRAFT_152453 [Lottia gigantea]ESP05596.1 hypothetical protein LOTGIDRAFT_152453 [Lottia gigantea]